MDHNPEMVTIYLESRRKFILAMMDGNFIGPFIYSLTTKFNKETMQLDLTEDTTTPHKIIFLAKGRVI